MLPGMTTKTCTRCAEVKDLAFFKKTKGGHQSWCRGCKTAYQRERRKTPAGREEARRYLSSDKGRANSARQNARPEVKAMKAQFQASPAGRDSQRRYRQSDSGREASSAHSRSWIQRNPEKRAAQQSVYYAVKKGVLLRPTHCPVCGVEEKIQAHHADYAKPLEVEWLCQRCHTKRHAV